MDLVDLKTVDEKQQMEAIGKEIVVACRYSMRKDPIHYSCKKTEKGNISGIKYNIVWIFQTTTGKWTDSIAEIRSEIREFLYLHFTVWP